MAYDRDVVACVLYVHRDALRCPTRPSRCVDVDLAAGWVLGFPKVLLPLVHLLQGGVKDRPGRSLSWCDGCPLAGAVDLLDALEVEDLGGLLGPLPSGDEAGV